MVLILARSVYGSLPWICRTKIEPKAKAKPTRYDLSPEDSTAEATWKFEKELEIHPKLSQSRLLLLFFMVFFSYKAGMLLRLSAVQRFSPEPGLALVDDPGGHKTHGGVPWPWGYPNVAAWFISWKIP